MKTRKYGLIALALLALCPGLLEAFALLWGASRGYTGMALRDGLDFWAGGHLALHGAGLTVFQPAAYRHFLAFHIGPAPPRAHLPPHFWSYPPNYLLIAGLFGWLPPWPAVLAFDACSLALLIFVLRLAGQPWALVLAVAASPAALENLLDGQNAALMTALIGGGLLLLRTRPRLAGILIGIAAIKPQLGLPLPAMLLRTPRALVAALLAALALGLAALAAFGPAAWRDFWQVTRPAMSAVLLTGKPPEFAAGLISVFAAARPLGVPAALAVQAGISVAAILLAAGRRAPATVLLLCALASPYLHDYDLLGTSLGVALLLRERLRSGFAPGEALLLFIGWAGPGALPWLPHLAHLAPLLLLLLLAASLRRDPLPACDSRRTLPYLPASSAGR